MKKTKKALASLAIAGMALTMVPFNAFADGTTVPTRLAGQTAAQTAVAIADQTGWSGAAVLASSASYGMVDALTAGPLATFLKAPILLQEPGAVLNADTKAELAKLNVKTVYVTSGTAVISQAVLDQISAMGITVVPLGGADRFETSVNIAKEMIQKGASVSKVAVAYGWTTQDALSIASIASAATEPILLTEKDALPASVQAFLSANPTIKSSDVIGGTGVVSAAVEAALPSATRHFGTTAYDTNGKVIQDFSSSLKFDNVYVANGQTGIDALAGAPLAAETNSAIVLTNGTVPAVASYVSGKLADGAVVTALGGAAVVPDAVRTGVVSGQVTAPQGALAVTSVAATGANAITVKFNVAPADTSKVTFAVANQGAPVTVTTTWNDDKTVATLSGSANYPEGTYTVAVKNGDTDLGSSNVSITQQKIAKININSTTLAVTQDGIGYATFVVYDQYNNDITNGYLANNISFKTGVGDITVPSAGIIKVTPTNWKSTSQTPTNLLTFSTVVLTAYDQSSGVSTSASLTTSTALGTISSIVLNKLTNANNAVLTAGDTSDTWYIDYTAKDMSGNDTNNYDLVSGGLILTGDNKDQLSTSSPYVVAKVVKDPSDNNKAAIQVTVTNDNIQMDLPVTITAMSYQGAPSSLSLTLKKQASVDSFTLMAPSFSIASGELKEIPFIAYDQNGSQITKYSDLTGSDTSKVTLTGVNGDGNTSATDTGFQRNPDGTASLWIRATNVSGTTSVPQIVTAVTPTGKLSTLTLNIQPAVKADTLALNSNNVISSMQKGAMEAFDFGENYGGLTVNDQYGRPMDMTAQRDATANYRVVATTTTTTYQAIHLFQLDSSEELVPGAAPIAYGGYAIGVIANPAIDTAAYANTPRTQTVNFYLIDKAYIDGSGNITDMTKVIDSQSVTFTVVKDTDIKDYAMQPVKDPLYAFASTTDSAITSQQKDWAANPYVFGLTSGGGKVMITNGSVLGEYVDNTTDFAVVPNVTGSLSNATNAFDTVKVVGLKLPSTETSASGNLTVTIKGADGLIHSVTTPITSSSDTPVAKSIGVSTDSTLGMHLSDDGNTVYLDTAAAVANLSSNPLLQRNDTNGSSTGRGNIYFYTKDQYGKKGDTLANIYRVETGNGNTADTTTAASDAKFVVSNGRVQSCNLAYGDYVVLTGVTKNGLMKTIKIVNNYNPT